MQLVLVRLEKRGRTKEDNMYPSLLKPVPRLLPRLHIPIIRIIDDDLPSLDLEVVPDLFFQIQLDLAPKRIRFVRPFRYDCQLRLLPQGGPTSSLLFNLK